jgi:UrcA family protein
MTLPRPIIACAFAAVLLSSAFADDVRFSYRTHELETPKKLEALVARIERTAQQVCRTESVLPPHYASARAACATDLITAIVSEIDDSRLYVAVRQELGMEILDPNADRFATTE